MNEEPLSDLIPLAWHYNFIFPDFDNANHIFLHSYLIETHGINYLMNKKISIEIFVWRFLFNFAL